ncbi:hypothetical protein ILUMI_27239 [Ignelater luminosus]|uniref:Glucose-methanol-choline oxidoreductase N-terminal domain-containing protein n=1 Tax=Ignelater luminosus TaxID=2038154 RepID=A0A8K0C8B9_IGNLU|nr:hypothetical protein ILUMI_27239 [Ignelater luminosus]
MPFDNLPPSYQSLLANFTDAITDFSQEASFAYPRFEPATNQDYDFIIVGSGSSGSVIANRLSEITNWKILLLEVGYPEGFLAQFPLLAPILQFTDYNWDYTMERQENFCRAMINQRCAWPRGKALGGTSVINYMIYTRGNPRDYDKWAALGNPGWSYREVLPYFLKSENSNLTDFNPFYHNKGGYLSVEDPFESELTTTFLQAGQELGYKLVDYNSPDQFGFSRIQATIKRGRRHSAAKAFLEPIIGRRNLRILTGARVTKLLINPTTKEAFGVQYTKGRKKFIARAAKEVILCAGAFNSPQLLMLAGIGPKEHLKELEIPLLVNLPVGQTLYDHISFLGMIFNTNRVLEPASNLFDPRQLLSWYRYGIGPLSSLGGFEALGYIKTNVSTEEGDYPDIEIILSGAGHLHTDYGLINRRTTKISDNFYYKMFLSLEGKPGFAIIPMLLHPKSKGYMKLRSKNPSDYPLFYGNHLTDPEGKDIKTLIAAIRFIIKLCEETDAFRKYNTRLETKPFVGCEHLEFNSDDYWRCALTLLTTTLHHQVSTCKMGPLDDPGSVVNHELRVHGVKNLRIADTSIIPITLSAHTNAPAIMIGEKASDIIKEFWRVT